MIILIDISWLAQNVQCEKHAAGQLIPCPGGENGTEKAMYILLVGRVDVTGTGKKPANAISLLPGDVFGGVEYFTGKCEKIYTAIVDSVVCAITESTFYDLSWSQPEIVFSMLKAAYDPPGIPALPVKTAPAASKEKTKAEPVEQDSADTGKPSGAEQSVEQPAEKQADSSVAQTSMLTGNSVFPEGHKQYPGITKPNYARLVYAKDYTCPVCKKTFKDYKIFGSKLFEAAPMRFDLRRSYTDFQLEWYDIVTCRHCYFSTFHSCYTESRPIQKQKIEKELAVARESVFLDFDAEREIDFVFTSHYLALICAEGYLTFSHAIRAKIWGNLSWLYEDLEDKEMEVFAASKAAEEYEEVYKTTRMTPVQEQTTCLSIAGMQLRAGIDKDIRKYLYQVKTSRMGDKVYGNMAEDLMEELRAK